MRNLILGTAAALAAVISPLAATSASAQPWGGGYGRGGNQVQREIRECRHELRRADSRRQYERARRECRREIAEARRDAWQDRSRRYDRYDRYDRRW